VSLFRGARRQCSDTPPSASRSASLREKLARSEAARASAAIAGASPRARHSTPSVFAIVVSRSANDGAHQEVESAGFTRSDVGDVAIRPRRSRSRVGIRLLKLLSKGETSILGMFESEEDEIEGGPAAIVERLNAIMRKTKLRLPSLISRRNSE